MAQAKKQAETSGGVHKGAWRAVALGVLVAAALAAAWMFLPLEDWLYAFRGWVRGFGALGALVLVGSLLLATLLMVPASTIYLAAGLLYGLKWGLAIAYGTALVGGALAFLLARFLLRARVEALIDRKRLFRAVDQAVREANWRVALLLRLAPLVPANVQNYAFGLTPAPLHAYLSAIALGTIPWVLLFTGLGSAGGFYLAREELEFGVWQWAMLGAGVVVLGLVVWLIARKARAHLEAMGIRPDEP